MQKARSGPETLCAGIITRRWTGWQRIKKKPALSLASREVLAGRYFCISSFFVASFAFAFPILTDTT
jgi:hypothetical protein